MAFVEEALIHEEKGSALAVNHAAAFKGIVLQAALHRFGDLKRVYRLFGSDNLVESRNHNQDFQREQRKVERFSEALEKSFEFQTKRL